MKLNLGKNNIGVQKIQCHLKLCLQPGSIVFGNMFNKWVGNLALDEGKPYCCH